MDQRNQYPSIGQAIWLLVWVLVLQFGLSFCVGILQGIVDHWRGYPSVSLADHPAALAAVNLIAVGLILMWGLKKTKMPFRAVFPITPIRRSLLIPMSLTIIGVGILLSEIDNMFNIVLPAPEWHIKLFYDLVKGEKGLWGAVVLFVVIAPITEELLFRGLILRGLLSRYTVKTSVLVSTILFSAFHLNPWQFLSATIFGVLMAWWFVRTRSLLPCIFGHALANALIFIVLHIFHLEIRGYTSVPPQIEFQPLWFNVVGLLLIGVGVWFLIQMFGKDDPIPFSSATGSLRT